MRVYDVARTVRSKNAGPFVITLDVIANGPTEYEALTKSKTFTAAVLGELLKCPASAIRVTFFPPALAVKVTLPREFSSGSVFDTDIFGCQQHVPLMLAEL